MLTSGTIIGDIVVNGEATASITITVPSAMFTFSPESINEATEETDFTIDMLTYPDNFNMERVRFGTEGDVISAAMNYRDSDSTYYIGIEVGEFRGVDRYGTVTFNYYDAEETTVLFTKTFTIALSAP